VFPKTFPHQMHQLITRRVVASAVAGACVVIAAGCGSGGHATGHASASPGHSMSGAQVRATARELAQCIRRHGVPNFPDPVYNDRTDSWELAPGTAKPPRSAMDACRSIASRLPSKDKHPPVTAADMAKLRQLAVCMRRHGLPDWPDPDADGAFALPSRLRQRPKEAMRTQLQACGQYFPKKDGIRISSGGTGNGG
jgi:hypothetical protein